MSEKAKVKLEFSAGGVLYRIQDSKVYIVLIETGNGRILSLPKGLVNKGEKVEEAALREVYEETGCRGRIIEPLGKIEYWYYREGFRIHKFVYYFLMEYIEGNVEDQDWEVERAYWIPADEAVNIMSYKNEGEIVQRALELINRRYSL